MKNFYLKETRGIFHSPEVRLNADTGQCKLTGESQVDNAVKFYSPIIDWLEYYTKHVREIILFDFKLIYFDTSSSKFLHQILRLLKKYDSQGGKVIINWHYPDENEDILDEGLQFSEDIGIDINFMAYKVEESY